MIKSALKLYRDNIFEVFAIIGIIAIGILIGVLVVMPSIDAIIRNNLAQVASTASSAVPTGKFDSNAFFVKMADSLNKLDWGNPFRQIKYLFEQGGLLNIINESLVSAGLKLEELGLVNEAVQNCIRNTLNGLTNQAAIFIACTGVFGLLAYVLTRIIIKIRSTSNHNIIRFILSLICNAILLVATFALIGVSLYYLKDATLYVVLVATLVALLIVSLLVSILIYKKKETRFSELFNIKTLLTLFLSCIIVLGISAILIIPVLAFSELIGLLIALPLLIVTNIIIENITINFVTEFTDRKRKKLEKNDLKLKKKEINSSTK